MWFDLRDGVRSLFRDRSFTALAILLLALTVGATTAVYAVVDAVILQPMMFGAQDRTVVIWGRDARRNTPVVEVALGEVESWRGRAMSFEAFGAFSSVNSSLTLVDGESRTRVPWSFVSPPFFEVVGVRPTLGRPLDSSDEAGPAPRAAVISNGLWKRHFGSDTNVVDRTVRVQRGVQPEHPLRIVGVMPEGFDFPRGADLWLPAAPVIRESAKPDPKDPANVAWYLANYRMFYGIGRLRPGITVAQGEEELSRVVSQTGQDHPLGRSADAVVRPVDDHLLGPSQQVLWLMLGGGALMVLLACSSVAGLHLFRSARQDRAIAIQLALGASRSRLIRRSLVESALLGAGGAIGAVAIAWVVTRALILTAPLDVPRLATAHVSAPSVLVVLLGLSTLTSVLTGVWPSVFIRLVDAGRTLTAGARTAMHPRERRIQRVVVGWQVAAAVVLLSGAALFVRSVQQLDRTPLGFRADGLLSIDLHPSALDLDGWDHFFDALRLRTEAVPHLTSTAAVSQRPLSGPIGWDTIPVLRGQEGLGPDAPWRKNPRSNLEVVTPGYFRVLGTRLLAGREFAPEDRAAAPLAVIVSKSAADRYWPGRDPLGQLMLVAMPRITGTLENPRWMTVVGVVEDVRYRGITDPRLDLYLPAAQSTIRVRQLLVRTTAPAAQLSADIRAIARELDPSVWVGEATAMTDEVARETAPWRFAMRVLSAFGVLAGALATVGLVALVSLVVALRRRELGIRAALGATPGRLRWHVLSEVMWTAVTAASVGVLAVLGLGRLVSGLLVDTPPDDAVSLAGAAVLTVAAGVLGCLRPAARAAVSDPAEVLRD